MMKILYTNFHTHHKGGHATYILNLWQELHQRHEIYIADPPTSGLNEAAKKLMPGFVIDQTFPKKLGQLPEIIKNVFKLRRLIKDKQIDIIHTNGSPDLQLITLACLGLRRPQIIYTKHNSIRINKNFFSKFKFKSAKQIIVVCGCQKPDFVKIGIPEQHVHVIKNGMDTTHFSPATLEMRTQMRAQLGIAPDDFVLVSSAGPSLYKRWDCMVQAVSKLPQKNIKIVIIGGLPPQEDKDRLVAPFGMSDRVIFTGLMDDTRPYVSVGDMGFVLSDNIETVSFACREMMSMGLPMIVSDFACLPENVTIGENGWVVPAGSVDPITEILKAVLAQPEKLAIMGQKARAQAVREFGIEHFAAATEAVYQKALNK